MGAYDFALEVAQNRKDEMTVVHSRAVGYKGCEVIVAELDFASVDPLD